MRQDLLISNLRCTWQMEHGPFRLATRQLKDFEMYWIIVGRLDFSAGRKKWAAKPGECWIWPKGSQIAVSSDGVLSAWHAHFTCNEQSSLMLKSQHAPLHGHPAYHEFFVFLLNELQAVRPLRPSKHDSAKTHALLFLVIDMLQRPRKTAARPRLHQFQRQDRAFQRINRAIQASLYSNASIKEIARSEGFHPDHMNRIFRLYTGQTIIAFRNGMRMSRARQLLGVGQTVKKTAELCGFSDALYFSRSFRKTVGQSPREFKIGQS